MQDSEAYFREEETPRGLSMYTLPFLQIVSRKELNLDINCCFSFDRLKKEPLSVKFKSHSLLPYP